MGSSRRDGRTGGGGAHGAGARAVAGAAALVVLGMGLGACGTAGDDASSSVAAPEAASTPVGGVERDAVVVDAAVKAAEQAAPPTTVAAAGAALSATARPGAAAPGGSAATEGSAIPALQPVDIGRSIIFTATVQVEVDSVATASDAAMTAVAGVGGYLFGQQSSNEPTPASVLTFKVAPERFQEALVRLGGLGTVTAQEVSSDDVTETVVDLQSRIAAAQVSVERLRGFLAAADDIDALAALERELLARESQLEQLNGQLRTVQAQVDLATITLTLSQPAPDGPALAVTVTAYAGADGGVTSCPGDDELELREGDAVTVCYELRNVGDAPLRDLRVDDPGLDLDRADLRAVQGDPAAVLAPGGVVVLAASREVPADGYSSPRVRAVAIDADGVPLRTEVQVRPEVVSLRIEPDTSRPGFLDALRRGGAAVATVASLLVVVVGFALPFVWVLPLAYVARLAWRRRRHARRDGGVVTGPPATVTAAADTPSGPVPGGTAPSGPVPSGTAPSDVAAGEPTPAASAAPGGGGTARPPA